MIGGRFIRNLFHSHPILCWVVIFHIVFLTSIGIYDIVSVWQSPPEEVIEIDLLEDLPEAEETAGERGEPEPAETETPPEPEPDPAPDPEPAPEPEPEPDPEPTWQARSADDIRLDGLRPAEERPRQPPRLEPQQETPPTRSADDIASSARQNLSRQGLTVDIPELSAQPQVSESDARRYLGAVITLLTQAWNQPSTSSVPPDQRTAVVELRISSDGSIRQSRISRSSGNSVMDQSIRNIFQEIDSLPPPRNYNVRTDSFDVNVVFELE